METAVQKVNKSEVIRNLLATTKLTPKEIARKAKTTRELVYQVRKQEARKKIMANRKRKEASVVDAKPFPNLSAKPKAPKELEAKMSMIDDTQRIDTLDFILNNKLSYSLGRAVDLVTNADKSADKEKDLLLAIRHIAIDIARARNSK